MKTNDMSAVEAKAVLEFRQTADGVGYNLWGPEAKFAELRPIAGGMFTMKFLPDGDSRVAAVHRVTGERALSIVRESHSLGKQAMLWMCCACGSKATSKALREVSHGYCQDCADKLRAEVLADVAARAKN